MVFKPQHTVALVWASLQSASRADKASFHICSIHHVHRSAGVQHLLEQRIISCTGYHARLQMRCDVLEAHLHRAMLDQRAEALFQHSLQKTPDRITG